MIKHLLTGFIFCILMIFIMILIIVPLTVLSYYNKKITWKGIKKIYYLLFRR